MKPVFASDRVDYDYKNYGGATNILGLDPATKPSPTQASHFQSIDALKRRYQVFVSSTYEDLKEERQHVIQALLETKCIPVGMELFPAASIEQWELIKRIIDECDYYLVIVAGRYGSLGKSGLGYTEMEFDYALSTGKPVIGFYHRNPDELPGSKLEKSDKARKRLKMFASKVKQRVCRPWSSSTELGSAVKSAILNELEFNARPGWVRADVAPSSDAVDRLKQRIADLEEKLKPRSSQARNKFLKGDELFHLNVIVSYDLKGGNPEDTRREMPYKFEATWDDLMLILGRGLERRQDTMSLLCDIDNEICSRVLPIVESEKNQEVDAMSSDIDETSVERILQTLVAKKLVKSFGVVEYGEHTAMWGLTPKGRQHLAELKAIHSTAMDS